MSEATLQADLQREFLRITPTFSTGDVTINDWSILDGPNANAPYIIIQSSDDFVIGSIQSVAKRAWSIPFMLVVRFQNWGTSEAELATTRQTVLDWLVNKSFASQSGALNFGIRSIRAGTPIGYIYDRYVENETESLPAYISQTLIVDIAEN